jgi:hypothetical protein
MDLRCILLKNKLLYKLPDFIFSILYNLEGKQSGSKAVESNLN